MMDGQRAVSGSHGVVWDRCVVKSADREGRVTIGQSGQLHGDCQRIGNSKDKQGCAR